MPVWAVDGTARRGVPGVPPAVVRAASRLVRYSLADGSELGSTAVPPGTVADLDADGNRVVFRTPRAIEVLDIPTGRIRTIARVAAGWSASAVAISGGTVVWAIEKRVAPGEPSRRTFRSVIRRVEVG